MPHEHVFTQTAPEERANALSHGLGCLLALLAAPALAAGVDIERHPLHPWGIGIFAATMVLMYGVSAAYHLQPVGPTKRWLRRCDHALIFVFIAGSFTPFALAAVARGDGAGPGQGLAMLLLVWALALAGMALKLGNRLRHRLASTVLYVAFGWLVAALARPLLVVLPSDGLLLLVAGGAAYTLGSLFFLLDARLRYSHFVWHLFVITGSVCHVLAVQQA